MTKEKVFEINGNLASIVNYQNFERTITHVYVSFLKLFGDEIMFKIPLYVDNATEMTGHTPIITRILGKYLCIKLGIKNFADTKEIIFQFAHELCHYVFYSLLGLDKILADEEEESICTAMSLCILREYYEDIQEYIDCVVGLENVGYRKGVSVAESINYKSSNLAHQILNKSIYNSYGSRFNAG